MHVKYGCGTSFRPPLKILSDRATDSPILTGHGKYGLVLTSLDLTRPQCLWLNLEP